MAPPASPGSAEGDDAPPNFFCRPGRGRIGKKGGAGAAGGTSRSRTGRAGDGLSGLDGGLKAEQDEDEEEEDEDPPRLAFLQAIVDHHTRARETRHNQARVDASTKAWNIPMPSTSSSSQARKPDPSVAKATVSNGSSNDAGSSGSAKGSGGEDQAGGSSISSASTSYQSSSLSAMSSARSSETAYSSPSLSPLDTSEGSLPDRTKDGKMETSHSALPQLQDGAKKVEEDQSAEQVPWFSQLASLPHLRSAGIPLKPSAQHAISAATPSKASATPSSLAKSGRLNGAVATSSMAAGGSRGVGSSATSLGLGQDEESQPLQPPDNFAMVNSWLYRSSFPKKKHFPFLKTLGLKSVLTLILEEYPEQNTQFLDEEGITFYQYGIPGNKEPFVQIPDDKIAAALSTMLDRRNHPMLIHCNKGKHRTGCLIGCLRKLQSWSLTTIFDEYRKFSYPKSRSMDQEFIELFDVEMVWTQLEEDAEALQWLPRWTVLDEGRKRIRAKQQSAEEEEAQQTKLSSAERCDEEADGQATPSSTIDNNCAGGVQVEGDGDDRTRRRPAEPVLMRGM